MLPSVGNWNGARREMEEAWQLVRVLRSGTRAMRAAGPRYTPMTKKEQRTYGRYQERLKASTLFPIYDRTVRKIASLPFQKPPVVEGELPEPLDRILENADRMGTSLSTFARQIYEDGVDRGMGLFLVDHVPLPQGASLRDADELDARPYFRRIAPDNLVGFRTEVRNGVEVVTQLRIRSWFYAESAPGIDALADRVEVWDETTVTIYEQDGTDQTPDRERLAEQEHRSGYRVVSSAPHGFPGIPLVVFYTKKIAPLQAEPPLEDLAWMNVAHWNSLSMQTEALRYCRSPILKISGVSQETADKKPELGPGACITDPGDVDISFVEVAGTSLNAGEVEVARIERQCQALGMQPLMASAGPDTATGEVRADSNEKSEAQGWIEAMEWAVYQGMRLAAKWVNAELPEDWNWTLFRDSSLIAGRATDVPVLVTMLQQGLIPAATGYRELALRGVLATVEDPEELAAEVEAEKERSMQRQMEAMAARMISERPGQVDAEDDDEEPQDGPPMPGEAVA